MKKIAKWLLFGNLFFLQSYLIRFEIGGFPFNLQMGLVGLVGVACLAVFWKERRWPRWGEHCVLMGFLGVSLVSLLAVGSGIFWVEILRWEEVLRYLIFLVVGGALVFVFLELLESDEERLLGLRVLSWGALCFGLFSVVYNLLGFNVTHDYRLLGPLDAAVYLAYYLVPGFLFFVISGIEGRWVDVVAAVLMGGMLVATRSMGALGGGFIVLVWYLFRSQKLGKGVLEGRLGWWVKFLVGGVGVALLVAIIYLKILPTINTPWSSLDERGEIWASAAHLLGDWRHVIFGVGLSQFEANYQLVAEGVLGRPPLDLEVIQPHNLVLLFWFHYGLLGLLFLGYLIWGILKRVWKLERMGVRELAGLMALYFLIHGVLDTPWYKNDLLFLVILFFSLAMQKNKIGEQGVGGGKFVGKVIRGEGMGRKLGFPTVNLEIAGGIDLGEGVYVAEVGLVDGGKFRGAVNYGRRKTFDGGELCFEVHILGFEGDLYGQEVEVEILAKIRDVKKFNSVEDLKRQIGEDVGVVRKMKWGN